MVDWAKPETIPGMPPIGALTAADQPGVVSGHIVTTNRRHAPQSRKLVGAGDPRTFPKDKYAAVGFSLTGKPLADVVRLSGGKYGVIAKWRSDDRAFAVALDQRCTEIIREAYDPALEALTRAGWGQPNIAVRDAQTSDADLITIAESLGISTRKRPVSGAKHRRAIPQRSGRLSSAGPGVGALSLSRDPAGPRLFPRPPSIAPPGFADAYLYGDRLFQRIEARARARREEARRETGTELQRVVSVEARVMRFILASRSMSATSAPSPSDLWEWAERLSAAFVEITSSGRTPMAARDVATVLANIEARLQDMGIERPNE
jgi:hypothetical protein